MAGSSDAGRQSRSLTTRDHRPWPVPQRPWLMGQTWNDLLFCHWPVPPDLIRGVVPAELPLDLRDGSAWVGVTPFFVSGLRLRGTPPVPVLSRFPEVNVRTYVIVDEKPGIYFLSLDTSRRSAVTAARRTYRLPYFQSRIRYHRRKDGSVGFESRRTSRDGPPANLNIRYEPLPGPLDAPPESIDRWFTERYCLYTLDEARNVNRGAIHHPPWPLRPARAEIVENGMTAPFGIELTGAPLVHFSGRQDVVLWPIEPAGSV